MSQKPKHHQDPSYAAFAERYRADIVAFAEEVLGLKVSPQMAAALRACSTPGSRVSITAEEVVPLAPLGMWRLFFGGGSPAVPSVTLVGCPTSRLINGDDYRRLAVRAIERTPWLGPYLRITGEQIYLDSCRSWESPCIRFLAVRSHTPENIAGFGCGRGIAWLLEDAHKINHACFRVAAHSLTFPDGCMAISSRGERSAASDGLGVTWQEFAFAGNGAPQTTPQRQ